MGFGATSDWFITVAWAISSAALVVTIGLALQVLVMRERAARREGRRGRLFATWRPILFEYLVGGTPPVPTLSRRDEESWLLLWNQLQDGVRGEPRTGLNAVADAVGAQAIACRLLQRGDAVARLLALRTLGYLGREGDARLVAEHLDDAQGYLGLAAAGAMVHIDPTLAPDLILPRLVARVDWPVPLFATVLSEADPTRLVKRFRALMDGLSPEQIVRVLPLVSILDPGSRDAILGALLTLATDVDVVTAALKRVGSPALLDHVRRGCQHQAWAVRTQAAGALGRVGEPRDRDLLLRALSDPQWWVRYRAAQALSSGRFGPAAEIAKLAALLEDRFARDIVAHALAEAHR